MKNKYIAIKDVPSGIIHFKHHPITKGTICEEVFDMGRYVISHNDNTICAVGSKMAEEYFRLINEHQT